MISSPAFARSAAARLFHTAATFGIPPGCGLPRTTCWTGARAAVTRSSPRSGSGTHRRASLSTTTRPTMGLAKVKLGSSDLEVTQVCLGTMTFGVQNNEAEAFEQLDYAVLERGVNFIDTAELYPVPGSDPAWVPGATETIVGRWLAKATAADPGLRARLVIATKITGYIPSSTIPGYRVEPPLKEPRATRLDAQSVRAAAEASLRRLGLDTIDLYQLHWPDRYVALFGTAAYDPTKERPGSVPIAETLGELKKLMDEGKIRHWGLSNETSYGVCQAVAAADALGMRRPATIQNSFCLIDRRFQSELAETCAPSHYNVSLLPWSPLAGGSLTGKYLPDAGATAEEAAAFRFKRFPKFQPRYVCDDSLAAVAAYAKIAKSAGMSVTTLSLAWCRSRWYVASTIIGATTLAHVKENIDAFDEALTLSDDVLAQIDEVHLKYRDPACA